MRFRHHDGSTVHLSSCTTVDLAEDLPGIRAQPAAHATPVRDRLGRSLLGLGLWLPRPTAEALAGAPAAVARLRAELTARGLEVVPLNPDLRIHPAPRLRPPAVRSRQPAGRPGRPGGGRRARPRSSPICARGGTRSSR